MSQYDNTNSGALFINDRKGSNDRQPNLRGSINVEGTEYWVSAWTKQIKNGPRAGQKMISLAIQPKEDAPAQLNAEDDTDIPF